MDGIAGTFMDRRKDKNGAWKPGMGLCEVE